MLILWRGWGLLAFAYPFVSVLVANLVMDAVGGAGTYRSSELGPGLGFVIAGILCWVTGRRYNGAPVPYLKRDEVAPDEIAAGATFRPRIPFLFARHNFFFVPLEAWGLLYVGLGLANLVQGVTRI
jgi:hypothetical protein